MELFAINGELYAGSMNGFVTSTDGGESWIPLPDDNSNRSGPSGMPVLETFNNTLYMKGTAGMAPQIFRFSTEDKKMIPIPGIPMVFEKPTSEKAEPLNNDLTNLINEKSGKAVFDALNDAAKQDLETGKAPNTEDIDFERINKEMANTFAEAAISAMAPFLGTFAVSGETYYVEYKQKLFRWKPGTDAWYNTGLVDSGENVFSTLISNPFRLFGWFLYCHEYYGFYGFQDCCVREIPFTSGNGTGISLSRLMRERLGTMSLKIFRFLLRSLTHSLSQDQPFMWRPTKVLPIQTMALIGTWQPMLQVCYLS